jgi:hypothetical protein
MSIRGVGDVFSVLIVKSFCPVDAVCIYVYYFIYMILSSNAQAVVFRENGEVVKKYYKKSFRAQLFRRQRRGGKVSDGVGDGDETLRAVTEVDLIATELSVLSMRHEGIVHLTQWLEMPTSIDIQMPDEGDPLDYMEHVPRHVLNSYLRQVFAAVEFLHTNGIAHGDLKPQNILLNRKTHVVKLCDFGSSVRVDSGNNTVPRTTPLFSSPEVCQHALGGETQVVDVRSIDMWALGITLHLLVFQRFPFQVTGTAMEVYARIMRYECKVVGGCSVYGDMIRGLLQREQRWTIDELCVFFRGLSVW